MLVAGHISSTQNTLAVRTVLDDAVTEAVTTPVPSDVVDSVDDAIASVIDAAVHRAVCDVLDRHYKYLRSRWEPARG